MINALKNVGKIRIITCKSRDICYYKWETGKTTDTQHYNPKRVAGHEKCKFCNGSGFTKCLQCFDNSKEHYHSCLMGYNKCSVCGGNGKSHQAREVGGNRR